MAPVIGSDLILISLTPSNGLPNSGSLNLQDAFNPKPNQPILSLKQSSSIASHCLSSVTSNQNKAGIIVASDWNRTVLNVWNWQNVSKK